MSMPTDPPLSRRAARQAEVSAQDAPPEGFAQPVTRRGRGGTPVSVPSSAPSDVAYRTQVRPRVPHYDATPSSRAAQPGTVPMPPTQSAHRDGLPEPRVEPPVAPAPSTRTEQVRRRDFRPPAEQPVAQEVPYDAPLDYHTQGGLRPDAATAASGAPASAAQPLPHDIEPMTPHEQTLSRRELRALREQQGLLSESPADTGAPVLAPNPEPAMDPVVAPAPAIVLSPVAEPIEPVAPESEAPVPVAPVLVAPVPGAEPVPAAEPVPLEEPVAPAEPWPLAQPAVEPSRSSSSAPTGSHWTVGIHDDDDPFENTFSREVGSTASLSNTNALVLPEMPIGSISGPVSGTGEIIVTGMIDLSRVVSSTGSRPTVHDSPDIDDFFDPGDLSAAPIDAAPVSALRAVSSHTGTQGVMASSRRPSANTVTAVLVGSTVVMAVVAIGLFVLAAMNGLF